MDAHAIDPLVQALKDESWLARRAAAEALEQIADTRASAPLLQALEDEEKEVRWAAALALVRIGDVRGVTPLIQALHDQDRARNPYSWHFDASILARIGAPAVEPLLQALRDRKGAVRRVAAKALGQIGDPRALPHLDRLQAQETMEGVRDAVRDAAARIRAAHQLQEGQNLRDDPTPEADR